MPIPDEQAPAQLDDSVREYLNRMFRAARDEDRNSLKAPILSALPPHPIVGKLYYFEVIPATVITIEGFYRYGVDNEWYYMPDICTNGSWSDLTGELEESQRTGGSISWMYPHGGNYRVPIMNGSPTRRWQIAFHVEHDPKQGSVIFPHVHWTNDAVEVLGNSATFLLTWMLAAGHDQANFSAPASMTITDTLNGTKQPWRHFIAQGTNPATQGIPMPEIDSLILMTVELQSAVGAGNVGGMFVDLHYEKERISTKENTPDFYT